MFRDDSEREGWNCERRRKSERRKINEDRAKRDPSYVYFEEIRIFPHFFQFQFFFFCNGKRSNKGSYVTILTLLYGILTSFSAPRKTHEIELVTILTSYYSILASF